MNLTAGKNPDIDLLATHDMLVDEVVYLEKIKRSASHRISEAALSTLELSREKDFLNNVLFTLSADFLAEPLFSDNDSVTVSTTFLVYASLWDAIKARLPRWLLKLTRMKVRKQEVVKCSDVKVKVSAVYPKLNRAIPEDQKGYLAHVYLGPVDRRKMVKKGTFEIESSVVNDYATHILAE